MAPAAVSIAGSILACGIGNGFGRTAVLMGTVIGGVNVIAANFLVNLIDGEVGERGTNLEHPIVHATETRAHRIESLLAAFDQSALQVSPTPLRAFNFSSTAALMALLIHEVNPTASGETAAAQKLPGELEP